MARRSFLGNLRLALLVGVLLFVAVGAWLDRRRSRDWDAPLRVTVYVLTAGDDAESRSYAAALDDDSFDDVESFLAEQAGAYGLPLTEPMRVRVSRAARALPPDPGAEPGLMSVVLWSLRMRWWAWRVAAGDPLPPPDIQLFAIYYPEVTGQPLPDSLGLSKGLVAVARLFAGAGLGGREPGRDGARAAAYARRERQVRPAERPPPGAGRSRRPVAGSCVSADAGRDHGGPHRGQRQPRGTPRGAYGHGDRRRNGARDRVDTMNSAEQGLACEALSVRVPGRNLVEALSMQVRPGTILAVLGRNGAGKSSTLHALAGLNAAASGEVRIDGRRLAEWPRRALARRLGLLTQAVEDPFPGTVLDAVLVGRHPHIDFWQWESNGDRDIARQALADVDLAELDEREIGTLSGGERRRLAVAAVLAQDPSIYLLDEPIQQLDPRHQIIVLEICRRLADTGRSVIMSLHDVGLAARYADEALLLFGDGRWLHGPEGEVLRAANIEQLYGLPVRELTWSSGRTYVPA